jgi:putative phage-type endonuclease
MFLYELPELTNILDEIVPFIHSFSLEESVELYDTCFHLMETYIEENPKAITEPDFEEVFEENITNLMYLQFEENNTLDPDIEREIDEIIEQAMEDFFKEVIPLRSFANTCILTTPNAEFIERQLEYLRSKPQPVQRTKEWYVFRHNLITASNAYKAFENQTIKNQLIYEKCQPLITEEKISSEPHMVNINTTLHWGQKYEPLSVFIYEHVYNTTIEDFGCIQHDQYECIGASPDGINVDPNSQRYGRMLEIKNVVNREIDGIPKKEYWIQMQLQMEVCNLDECDFLETKFVEYESSKEFDEDGTFTTSHDDKKKGIIMYFSSINGTPVYVYKPIEINTETEFEKWMDEQIEQRKEMTWIKNYYWKLEVMSCVLVLRNKKWFQENVWELQEVWNTILLERETSFEHRAPNKRVKKEGDPEKPPVEEGCFWNVIKTKSNEDIF